MCKLTLYLLAELGAAGKYSPPVVLSCRELAAAVFAQVTHFLESFLLEQPASLGKYIVYFDTQ